MCDHCGHWLHLKHTRSVFPALVQESISYPEGLCFRPWSLSCGRPTDYGHCRYMQGMAALGFAEHEATSFVNHIESRSSMSTRLR